MIKARIDKNNKYLQIEGSTLRVAAESCLIIDIIWRQIQEDDADAAEMFRQAVVEVLTKADSPMAWNAVASKEGTQDDQV